MGFGGAAITADAGNQPLEANLHAPGQLTITTLTNPGQTLSKEESHVLIEDARQRALSYNEFLPNFMCIEVTNRSIDAGGNGRWKLKDTLVELLRYREKTETRTMLEVNGKASTTDREAMKGALSAGEFGGVLQAVFRVASQADFQWKETASLSGGTVQVYDYRVDRKNSVFSVTGSNDKQLIVGFHGQVYIDSATRNARRITLVADDLPKDFPTHIWQSAVMPSRSGLIPTGTRFADTIFSREKILPFASPKPAIACMKSSRYKAMRCTIIWL